MYFCRFKKITCLYFAKHQFETKSISMRIYLCASIYFRRVTTRTVLLIQFVFVSSLCDLFAPLPQSLCRCMMQENSFKLKIFLLFPKKGRKFTSAVNCCPFCDAAKTTEGPKYQGFLTVWLVGCCPLGNKEIYAWQTLELDLETLL